MSHPSLEPRLLRLLRAVVDEYQRTAQPVGSQAIVDATIFEVSSATIRNWFAELDHAGYLMQPHTSGGRIPTEAGYRLYLDTFLEQKALSRPQAKVLEETLRSARDVHQRPRGLARAIAEMTDLAVFVRFGSSDTYYTGLSQLFAQPEFRDWERVVSLSEILDRLDDALHELPRAVTAEPRIFLGEQSPFGSSCSAVCLVREEYLMGVLGPMRMHYQLAHSALLTAEQLLH